MNSTVVARSASSWWTRLSPTCRRWSAHRHSGKHTAGQQLRSLENPHVARLTSSVWWLCLYVLVGKIISTFSSPDAVVSTEGALLSLLPLQHSSLVLSEIDKKGALLVRVGDSWRATLGFSLYIAQIDILKNPIHTEGVCWGIRTFSHISITLK